MDFHRVRIKIRKSGGGNKFDVVRETHNAGNWNGDPDKVDVLDRGLTRDEAIERAKRERL